VELNQCLKTVFGKDEVSTLLFFAPTYPTGMWSLQLASKGSRNPAKDFSPAQARDFAREHKLRYYHEGVHAAAFALPGFVREMLHEQDRL
jgi:spermidine synthase